MPRKIRQSLPRAGERAASYRGSARIHVVVPAEVRESLDALAAEEGTTVSELCRSILEEGARARARARLYREVARTYPAQRDLYLALLRTYEGMDQEVRRR